MIINENIQFISIIDNKESNETLISFWVDTPRDINIVKQYEAFIISDLNINEFIDVQSHVLNIFRGGMIQILLPNNNNTLALLTEAKLKYESYFNFDRIKI